MNFKLMIMIIAVGFSSLLFSCEQPNQPPEEKDSTKKTDTKLIEYAKEYGPFQDLIINNQIVFAGPNSNYCLQRYAFIKAYIQQWNSPVQYQGKLSMIDLGAAQGYFSFKLAHEMNIKSVMVEDGQSSCKIDNDHLAYLMKLCRANHRCEAILLAQTINLQSLHCLNLFEHFNVVLALNVVHYLENWKECLHIILELGDLIFIEIPIDNENKILNAIHDYFKAIKTKDKTTFIKPSKRKTVLYVIAKNIQKTGDGITYFNYIQGNCLWPEVKQASLAEIPADLAPSEVTINHRGEVILPRGVSASGMIRSRL